MRVFALTFGLVTMIGAIMWGLGQDEKIAGHPQEVSRGTPVPLSFDAGLMTNAVAIPQAAAALPAKPQAKPPQPDPLQQVAAMATLAYTPVTSSPAPSMRPVARPKGIERAAQARAQEARLQQVAPRPDPKPTQEKRVPVVTRALPVSRPAPQQATLLAQADTADVDSQMRAMGMGVLQQLLKPKATEQGAAMAPIPALAGQPPLPQATQKPSGHIPQGKPQRGVVAPVAPEKDVGRTYVVQPGDSLPGIAFRVYGSTVGYLQILAANTDQLSDPSQLKPGMELRIPDFN